VIHLDELRLTRKQSQQVTLKISEMTTFTVRVYTSAVLLLQQTGGEKRVRISLIITRNRIG